MGELRCSDVVVVLAQHHVCDVVLRVNHENQGHVNHHKYAVESHSKEVNGTRRLTVVEELDVAREASCEGWGHDRSGRDHQRRDNEDDCEVHELLQCVIGLEVLDRRDLQAHVDLGAFPGLGENRP